jgi:putative membrane protein
MGFLVKLILKIAFTALGIWVASRFIPGIKWDQSYQHLAIAAIVLGLVNAIVRPIITILTLPITVLTLGLFLLVVNGLMLLLVSFFLKGYGFTVEGLVPAILGAIVIGVISWIGHMLIGEGSKAERRR